MLISVVIATRNRSEQLHACLESLRLSPTPPGCSTEIIVVDNASTDGTATVVASFEDSRADRSLHYMNEPRLGKAFAVNRGTAAARGAIVAFLDDDVVTEPTWLTEIVERFERDPGLGVLAGRVLPMESANVAVTRSADEVPLSADRPLEGLVLGCNLAVRPGVVAATKGRDTRLGPGRGLAYEDIDFVYRALRAGFRGVFSPRPTVFHRPAARDRRREYLRGRGAYYAKYMIGGDLHVARQAWWELAGIFRELAGTGPVAPRSPLSDLRQLATGAGMMLARMALTFRPRDSASVRRGHRESKRW